MIVKLTLVPLLVGLMSEVARRWGPTVGGFIMGLPWMTGPILLFLSLEKGEVFGRGVAIGVLIGTAGIGVWAFVYATMARFVRWPSALAAAAVAYFAVGYAIGDLALGLWPAAALASSGLIASFIAMPRPAEPDGPRFLPWWDIPLRMAATAALVGCISIASEFLGPQLSGVAAAYPVILTTIGAFTHYRWGAAAVIRMLRSVMFSLISFVMFFVAAGSALESHGAIVSFAFAVIAASVSSALVVAAVRSGVVKT